MDYCKFGKGEKVLVILPGLANQSIMGSADAVAEAYKVLTKDITIYLFERRNELPKTYSVADNARDVVIALETLALNRINMMGVSYGGMTSMEIATRHPELVEKLILASTSANVTEEEFKEIERWLDIAERGDATSLYLAFGEALYPQDVFEQAKSFLIGAAKTVTHNDIDRFITFAKGMKDFNILNRLGEIQCPVLFIRDKQDRVFGLIVSNNLIKQMNDLTNFQVYMYDGYGHAVYDTAPDFKERMLEFLKT